MTCIAYRDGVLAADTLTTAGDSKVAGITKIARGPDGRMGGASGNMIFARNFLAWVEGKTDSPPEIKTKDNDGSEGTGMVIWADGRIEIYEPGGSFVIEAPYYAIGCGRPEALGALFAGADAPTAVAAAIAHDCHCGGEITVLKREA